MIKFEYQNAMNQAKRLRVAAGECKDAIKHINEAYGESEGCWKGSSGDAMRRQFMAVKKDLEKYYSNLLETAKEIERVAKSLKEADEASAARTEAGILGAASNLISSMKKFV